MRLFVGSASTELGEQIAAYLKMPVGKSEFERFSDRECIVRIKEDIRGEDVYLVQSTCNPVNENLMELLIMADACLNNGAKRIHAIVPYYGYSRQDRITQPGEPITTRLVAKLIEAAGINSVTTMDIHSEATANSFKIKFHNLHFTETLAAYLEKKIQKNKKDFVVVAPDHGALERVKTIAKKLNVDYTYMEKKRNKAEEISRMELMGEVRGKNAIIVDDLIGTGGTLIKGADILKKNGANEVFVAATHGVFANNAVERFEYSVIKEVIVSDTIAQKKKTKKLTIISVAKDFAKHISRQR